MQARSRAPGWSDTLIPISQQVYGRVVGRIRLVDGVENAQDIGGTAASS